MEIQGTAATNLGVPVEGAKVTAGTKNDTTDSEGYYAITGLVNHTTVTLTASKVAVRHGPLPWPGSRALDRTEVEQLYVSRQETSNKGQVTVTFNLQVVLRGGEEVEIPVGVEIGANVVIHEFAHVLDMRDGALATSSGSSRPTRSK